MWSGTQMERCFATLQLLQTADLDGASETQEEEEEEEEFWFVYFNISPLPHVCLTGSVVITDNEGHNRFLGAWVFSPS